MNLPTRYSACEHNSILVSKNLADFIARSMATGFIRFEPLNYSIWDILEARVNSKRQKSVELKNGRDF